MNSHQSTHQLFETHYQKLNRVPKYIARKYHYKTYMGEEDFCQEGHMKVWETLLAQPTCTTSYLRYRIHSGIFAAYKRGKSLDNDYQNVHRRSLPVSVVSIDEGISENLVASKRLDPEQKAIGKVMFERFLATLSADEKNLVKLKLLGFKNKEAAKKIRRGQRKITKMLKSIRARFDLVYGLV